MEGTDKQQQLQRKEDDSQSGTMRGDMGRDNRGGSGDRDDRGSGGRMQEETEDTETM